MAIEDRDLTLALGHRDFTHLDINLEYYPTSDEDVCITPRIQPFVLRDAPRPRISTFWINDTTPYLLRLEVFPSVKYVCIRNMLAAPPAELLYPIRVSWYDNISGDYCVTSCDNDQTLVIPNPRKYDADLDLYGIEISTVEEQISIPVYAICVGSEVA